MNNILITNEQTEIFIQGLLKNHPEASKEIEGYKEALEGYKKALEKYEDASKKLMLIFINELK